MTEATEEKRTLIHSGSRGLQLTNLDEMWRFATCVCKSGLAPKGVDTPESVLVALQMGAELGLTPMASLQNIAVINGRPSVWGDAQLAVCRGSGCFDESAFSETFEGTPGSDQWTAVCEVRRTGDAKLVRRAFSVADAKKAGLWAKQGPWTQYPQRMLQMRARSWALRDTFSDILRGFRQTEEAMDGPCRPTEDEPGVSRSESLVQRLAKPAPAPETPTFNPPTPEEQDAADSSQVDPVVDQADGVDEPEPDPQSTLVVEAEQAKTLTDATTIPALNENLRVALLNQKDPEARARLTRIAEQQRLIIRSKGKAKNKTHTPG